MRRGNFPASRPRLSAGREATVRESIAVIVIGLNVAAWLAECLDSILAQSLRPDELIYCDDSSDDESVQIAHARGVPVVHCEEYARMIGVDHVGMSAARMEGLSQTTSTLILCVDGDNVLPPDYLAKLYEALGPQHVMAYPGEFRFIGDRRRVRRHSITGTRELPKASRRALWRSNHVDTCALMRRADLIACGGWRDNPSHRMNDWDMALRMSARGPYVRSDAVLHYRLHTANNSSRDYGMTPEAARGAVRRQAASITVATVYSGRLPELFTAWLAAIAASLRAAGKEAELLIMDDSPEGLRGIMPDTVFRSCSVRRVHRGTSTAERRPDRRETAEFLAAVFNDVLRMATGDIVWMIEDDVMVPEHAAELLLQELVATPEGVRAAVAGCYRSRHNTAHWVASNVSDGRAVRIADLPAIPAPVDITGTGCLMLLRDMLGPVRFTAEWTGAVRVPAHDWTLSYQLAQRGTPVVLVPDVLCRHHTSVDAWV